MANKIDIRKLRLDELKNQFEIWGEKSFRAKQVYEWLWKKSAFTFDEMTNLSLNLRNKLNDSFEILPVKINETQRSTDGTIKSKFQLHDGHFVEGVLIPTTDRITACVSSQVGCSLACKFCATGFMERARNLDYAEIYDQVVLINQQANEFYGMNLTNIVFMGMGEPLLNYQNVLEGIEKITSTDGLNISAKRITVSTAGIAKMIKKLGDDNVRFNLALSLHAANDQKRNEIMAINETNNLSVLNDALSYFYHKTGNDITLEYIAFNHFNDSIDDAKALVNFARKVPCKINIIEYNSVQFVSFEKSDDNRLISFKEYLEKNRLTVNIRRSRGKDIDAACGQLAVKGVIKN